MTYLDLYSEVKEMKTIEDIMTVIKKGLLEELAGDDFSIKEVKKVVVKHDTSDLKKRISNEIFKRKNEFEKNEGRKITPEEKQKIREEVEIELS